MNVDFNVIKEQCTDIAKIIKEKKNNLIKILIQYEPYNVAQYEIERCVRTLNDIDKNQQYFKEKVDVISVFMPSNLPLYSLVIFALIPGFIAEELYVHPNTTLRQLKIMQNLYNILKIKEYLSNVNITSEKHDVFIEKYVKRSRVIIFTGRGTTRAEIEKVMPKNSILIFNGSGHNPVVVAEDADIDKAVKDSIFVKFFNSGQDCAGPDSIFIHKKIADEFIEKFKNECSKLIVGKFSNKNTFIGPIHQKSELKRLEKIIGDNKDNVIYGGKVDYDNLTVHPTIILSKMTEKANFQETFGPIAFIIEYEEDEELKLYFQDKNGRYQYNKMYVSLYGNSRYIRPNCDAILFKDNANTKNGVGIVLNNQTVHDVEIGTKAYGGYSKGASAVIFKNSHGKISSKALPILIPEVITELMINKKTINNLQVQSFLMLREIPGSDIDFVLKIEYEFKQQVKNIFANNIEFAFVFGSIAKRTFRRKESDIDTFICLKEDDKVKTATFIEWIVQFQYSLDLKSDLKYPSEITTHESLESAVENLKEIKISFSYSNEGYKTYDKIFWACVLPSFHKKRAFIGGEEGGKKLSSLAKKCQSYPKKWGEEFMQLLDKGEEIPISLQKCYEGLNKEKIKQKLTKLLEEHEYCEIMRLIEFNMIENANSKASCRAYVKNELSQASVEDIESVVQIG
ncbi:aldehyde dehydrogenase family protein [Candidatus Mesenet endosymbiont of Agriotes lineatus]|uniref:aldehyde dehydrogenase family protein n=1 Tax=Candidatus Mesenet endosymbiont of Agriotes lineatus TaxID=3077948 RepID=UPI0030D0BEBB